MKGPDEVHRSKKETDEQVSADAAGIKVLLAEHSESARRATRSSLELAGYAVITAVDGFDALSKVVAHRPHVVILDILMPRLDGYQVCTLIKNSVDYRNSAVVLLAAKDSEFDEAYARIAGCDGTLARPVDAESLTHAIHSCMAFPDPFDKSTGNQAGVDRRARAAHPEVNSD